MLGSTCALCNTPAVTGSSTKTAKVHKQIGKLATIGSRHWLGNRYRELATKVGTFARYSCHTHAVARDARKTLSAQGLNNLRACACTRPSCNKDTKKISPTCNRSVVVVVVIVVVAA